MLRDIWQKTTGYLGRRHSAPAVGHGPADRDSATTLSPRSRLLDLLAGGEDVNAAVLFAALAADNAPADTTVSVEDLLPHALHLSWTCSRCGILDSQYDYVVPVHPRMAMEDPGGVQVLGHRTCPTCSQQVEVMYIGFTKV